MLGAVVPVCAGISLEYYFSFVDNDRYGCGTKLPHNVTGLVGVMDGHASDLRTGLPWQMVEIHEPVRILFVIETTPERLMKVVDASASLKQLVENRWIRVAVIDPESGRVHVRRDNGFEEFEGPWNVCRWRFLSAEWYGGKIDHLAMAWIQAVRQEEAGTVDYSASHAGICGARAGRGFRRVGAAVAAGLGSTRALGFQNHGRDFFCVCSGARRGSSGARCDWDSGLTVTFGNWFAVHDYHFPMVLMADRLSLPFLGMTVVLVGLIGRFSATYLHREPGFFRFFLLLHLFAFGSLIAFAAGSFDLLVGGWEIVGITSVLLIAFFQYRTAPVENALRVFAVYRALRHRIAGGRVRHASLGRNRFVRRRLP